MSELLINDIKSNNSELKSYNEGMQIIEEMAEVLKNYTERNYIMASHVILECYAEELYSKNYRKQREGENLSQMHPSDEFICEKCGLIIRECCRYEIDEDDGDEICYEFPYRFCPRCGMKVKGGAE